ncbi:N-carbamoylputrescine amidase [Cetobacterium sp. 2A]|uniref:N-carbamoylputrescine amidase n=1 Tax=Cetobacterium sp. 2A TaxID=2754723 RepID=UPI00163D3130|nr:N-carbamoylputrescine amidase [Cetobacterium sp. 2A]MBC2855872.1 N-carbamoylputrescine amidase [Cetobacterium sp. 2A]
MKNVKVATVQMSMGWDVEENIKKAEKFVRAAAADGAKIILISELFERVYFCAKEIASYMDFSIEKEFSPAINHFKTVAKELGVVLPISFYERKNNARYNAIAIIDADGEVMGIYRKSHIPDDVSGYQEKFYFNIGDTGFKVWDTKYAKIGVAICWDQWFPESARCMSLMGAEILFYPTAIGSEPSDPTLDSKDHWHRVMQGHAAANMVPIVAANRVGTEHVEDISVTFYGSSFITDDTGAILSVMDRTSEGFITANLDLEAYEKSRAFWGLFRDRRPDLYGPILTMDGETKSK